MRRHNPGAARGMSFDPARLRHWPVPDVEQTLTRRDTAFYAMSTGYGSDPLSGRTLRFVDPVAADLQASPSMALVLGYPGFWLGDPATGVDAARVLHLDQAVHIERSLPVEGPITGRTAILDLIDRGEGRGALLVSERTLFAGGVRFARLVQTHLLRSEGGFAAQSGTTPLRRRAPDTAPDRAIGFTLPESAALLYRLNGDFNPLHSDPDVAARGGFRRPIMHGMGTFGFVTRYLAEAVCGDDPARIASIAMRFASPAYPGEHFTLHLWDAGAFSLVAADGRRVIEDGAFSLR